MYHPFLEQIVVVIKQQRFGVFKPKIVFASSFLRSLNEEERTSVLKHEKYSKLRDVSNNDWAFNPLDPGTYEIQFDLYRDAIEATQHGKYLHDGEDEVRVVDR